MCSLGALVRNTQQFDVDYWEALSIVTGRSSKIVGENGGIIILVQRQSWYTSGLKKAMDNFLPLYRSLYTERALETYVASNAFAGKERADSR